MPAPRSYIWSSHVQFPLHSVLPNACPTPWCWPTRGWEYLICDSSWLHPLGFGPWRSKYEVGPCLLCIQVLVQKLEVAAFCLHLAALCFYRFPKENFWLYICWNLRRKDSMLRHSMPRWSERSLRSRQHPYPELQSKAWNVAWLLFGVVIFVHLKHMLLYVTDLIPP